MLTGQLLFIVVTLFHAEGKANNHRSVFAEYAASGSWKAVHLLQFAAIAILLAGLFALYFALDARAASARWAGRFGAGATVVTLARYGVLQAVDGGAEPHTERLRDMSLGGAGSSVSSPRLVMPPVAPSVGDVCLRAFEERDAGMLMNLSTDPYVPEIGSLPADASREDALAFIGRQIARLETGAGYSFCVADKDTDEALGTAGLNLAAIAAGRATAGYAVAPRNRGRRIAGQALTALTRFAWSVPELYRVELYIEPWNMASVRTAELAGYEREGLLRSHQEIGGRRVDMFLYAAIRRAG